MVKAGKRSNGAAATKATTKKAAVRKVPAKKTPKKKPAARRPIYTAKDFEQFFYKLDLEDFVQYTKLWNQRNLKIKVPKHDNYDDWLNYFKTISASASQQLAISGMDFLPTDAFAALSMWHDIIKHPHRIGKIHQSGLTGVPVKGKDSILTKAQNGDRMGVLCAVRDQLAEKLEKGAGARDMASLARELGDVLDQIADLEKRSGPNKGTKVAQLLSDFNTPRKRPGANGAGARHTSFRSRVTIDDTEGKRD